MVRNRSLWLCSQALEFRMPLFPHLVPPAIMVWIFVWKYMYIFEPFIHILQHFVLQFSHSTNFCFYALLPFYLKKHKGKKQSSKHEEGILASTQYFILDDTSNFPPLVPIQEVNRAYFVSRYLFHWSERFSEPF